VKKKRVTIKDIAKKAGVTHPTVSRALRNDPRVNEKTRIQISAIAKKMGYKPNLIARSLAKSTTDILGFIIPDLNPHVQPILRGVVDACTRHEYGLMLFSTSYWSEESLSYTRVVDNWRVDGVLIYNVMYHKDSNHEMEALQCKNTPCVFINKHLRSKTHSAIGIDNYNAVSQAVNHLVNLGHTRIGIMNGSMKSVDGMERHQAFKKALSSSGLTYHEKWIGCGDFGEEEAFDEMHRILNSSTSLPTAMFCASDGMAIGVIHAIERNGLRVPNDIAVIGFDDIDTARHFKPSLTTLRPPLRQIGEMAVDLLVKRMAKPRSRAEKIPMNAHLIIRDSTGINPAQV